MWKQYKKHLILSSVGILLPIFFGLLFWNQLPDFMVTHWGANGQADGMSPKAFTVFFLPVILLAAHWLCLYATRLDPRNRDRNRKVFLLVMWIMPVVSMFSSALIYSTALGYVPNFSLVILVPVGLLFVIIGNYLPKCQQNHTIGIKLSWTLANEENWNLTHRFGGKCWLLGGLGLMLCAFLPVFVGIWVMVAAIFVLAFLPMFYSWRIYRRHRQQGIEYPKVNVFGSKKASRISMVFLILLLIFVAWIMFTGDITYSVGAESFTIEADFYADLTVSYDNIDSIEFREGNVPGLRVNGFNSARLLLGTFQNEEFGVYTRYSYTNPDGCILIRNGSHVLVLSAGRYSETLKLYMQLLDATSSK